MKLVIRILTVLTLSWNCTTAQDKVPEPSFNVGIKIGYDLPTFSFNYPSIGYDGGVGIGLAADYFLPSGWGVGLDYDFLVNSPTSLLSSTIAYPSQGLSAVNVETQAVHRHFLGLGPSYRIVPSEQLSFVVGVSGGMSLVEGGDILAHTINPGTGAEDYHLVQTGFAGNAWAAKTDLSVQYWINQSWGLTLGVYYLRHFGCAADDMLDVGTPDFDGLIYGATDFDTDAMGQMAVSDRDALVIREGHCGDISSVGARLGIAYRPGRSLPRHKQAPAHSHSVIVTVQDGPSGKLIPDADVVVRDMDGVPVATGTSNAYGLVQFGELPAGDYHINGKVYKVETSDASLTREEFAPGAIIRKTLAYEDLRFILKGKTSNKTTRQSEPNVVVSLTNTASRAVNQETTDGTGAFAFRLDPASSYEVVGIKENILSEIERASTMGLTRSTTLFVDLELGVESFPCGQGTILDIKYEYDSADLLPESKFELDRLVRYMQDHSDAIVELSSHTDSRGSDVYNLDLSQRRAQSAVGYIVSRGVVRSRIIATGKGETQIKNQCGNGVQCSDDEHRVNRRTEAKLKCR